MTTKAKLAWTRADACGSKFSNVGGFRIDRTSATATGTTFWLNGDCMDGWRKFTSLRDAVAHAEYLWTYDAVDVEPVTYTQKMITVELTYDSTTTTAQELVDILQNSRVISSVFVLSQ